MSVRMSNWQAGPRRVAVHYLRNLAVSLVSQREAIAPTLEASGIGYCRGPVDVAGVRLDFEGTKGHAFIELSAEPNLPAAIALLRKLRDACNHALNELESTRERVLEECHHCHGAGREPLTRPCATCQGTGRRPSIGGDCLDCQGKGKLVVTECSVCVGRDYGPLGRRIICARCKRVTGGYGANKLGGPR